MSDARIIVHWTAAEVATLKRIYSDPGITNRAAAIREWLPERGYANSYSKAVALGLTDRPGGGDAPIEPLLRNSSIIVPRVLGFPVRPHPSEAPGIDEFVIRMTLSAIYREKQLADQRASLPG